MPNNSQSHLFSLANLLESAEKRHSTAPPPAPAATKNDSGLIDFIAIQNRAREEQARAAAAPTSVPITFSGPTTARASSLSHGSVPDFIAVQAQSRRKHLLMGAVAGSVALVAFAVVVAFSGGSAPPPAVAAARTPITTVVTPPPPVVAPPPVAPVAAAPEPVAPAVSEPIAANPHGKKGKSHKHASHSKGGPKMTKVASGGT